MNWQKYGKLMESCKEYTTKTEIFCNCPKVVADVMRPLMKEHETQEGIYVIAVSTTLTMIEAPHMIFIGTVDRCIIHPRDALAYLLSVNAKNFILAHNHPSGDLTSSPQDDETTKMMLEAGKAIGIPLLDHIIVSTCANRYTSFRANGFFAQYK